MPLAGSTASHFMMQVTRSAVIETEISGLNQAREIKTDFMSYQSSKFTSVIMNFITALHHFYC